MNNTFASLGPALADHLWQSTAFAVVAWLMTLALRKNLARVRYGIWLAASIKFLVPFSLLVAAGNLLPHPKEPVAPVVYSAMDVMEEPFAQIVPLAPLPVHVRTLRERAEAVVPVCLGTLWVAGLGAVLFGWWNRWRVLSRSLHHATPAQEGRELEILRRLEGKVSGAKAPSHSVRRMPGLKSRPISETIELLLSAERMEPGVFGVFRPVLVWPERLSARLDDEQIEAIVAHELTHVRRRDNLTALIHMLVEAAFWFHPLVWWMERQMVKEREQACDEAVVEMGGSAETYAESLLKTCRFCIESPLPCVAGVTGADLRRRVADIVTGRALLRMTWPKKLLIGVAMLCAVVAPVVLGQAKAAQRMMLAAIKDAPRPIQFAAHAMIAEEQTPASGEVSASETPEIIATNSASDPAFEVATIRPANDNDGRQWWGFRLTPSGRLTVSGVVLEGLVGFSSIRTPGKGQVSGGPSWGESQKWDITAEADTSTIPGWNELSDEERMDRIKPMLLKLVIERFHLKVHTETRPYSVYAMVPAKGGVKLGGALKRVDPPPAHADPEQAKEQLRNNKLPLGAYSMGADGAWVFRSVRPYIIAMQVAVNCRIDGMVVDQSGLDGYYDLTFKPLREQDAPPLQDQVEEQLGLRFEAKKVPMPTYIIDSAEKPSVDGSEVAPTASVVPVAMVQEKASSASANDSAQPPAYVPTMTFDVASIRPLPPAGIRTYGGSFLPHSSLFRMTADARTFVHMAYGIDISQISGLPDWTMSEMFDVEAKGDGSAEEKLANLSSNQVTLEQQHMVQMLLAERFKLKAHWETKEGQVYDLVVAKAGTKLHPPGSTPPTPEELKIFGDRKIPEIRVRSVGLRGIELIGHHCALASLILYLDSMTGTDVVDKTGLSGTYDFDLQSDGRSPDDGRESDPNKWPRLIEAVQDQLGLKLEPAKGSIRKLVIDHIERPSGN